MRRHRHRHWRAVVLAAAVGLAGAAGIGGSAPSAEAAVPGNGAVDFSWLPPPQDFVASREIRQLRRVPPLLTQACVGFAAEDVPKLGEDYDYSLLARVEMLRMLDSKAGTDALRGALNGIAATAGAPVRAMADPGNVLRNCLTAVAPDWNVPYHVTAGGVFGELRGALEMAGLPGTDKAWALCRATTPAFGNADLSQAMILRVWLRAMEHVADTPSDATLAAGLDQHMARVAWLQGARAAIDESPCTGIPETENHQLLIESTRYLHNEWLPMLHEDELQALPKDTSGMCRHPVCDYVESFDSNNDTNGVGAWLQATLADYLQHDFREYNARPYTRWQMTGLLNLYDFARDDRIRAEAGAVLDLVDAKMVAESMSGLRTAPYRRKHEKQSVALFAGDTLAPMSQVWVGNLGASARPSLGFNQEMALAASTGYHPPDVLTDVMLDRGRHVYRQSFNGQGQGERAVGAPDFTIAGGGLPTECPYPSIVGCVGSGNDPGDVQPIVFLPRRPAPAAPSAVGPSEPTFATVIHSFPRVPNTCIAPNVACGPNLSAALSVLSTTRCSRRFKTGDDDIVAWRVDVDCTRGSSPLRGDCFFVYRRRRPAAGIARPVLTYLVAHECGSRTLQQRRADFDDFVRYLTSGSGRPLELRSGEQTCFNRAHPCALLRVRLPSSSGQVRRGSPVTFIGGTRYDVRPRWPDPGAAGGDLARVLPGPRLELADPGAGERLVERPPAAPLATEDPRGLWWSVIIAGNGHLTARVKSVDQPGLLQHLTLSSVDLTQLQQDCTVTLPDGHQGCYDPHRLCGDPPVPCTDDLPAADKQVQLAAADYRPGMPAPTADHPLTITGELPSVDKAHRYTITLCAVWWRFLTSADYRAGDSSLGADGSGEHCENVVTKPISLLQPYRRPQ
jgi:hypothetical protein